MSDMAEDRVYEAEGTGSEALLAAGIGVVSVELSGDRVGGFGIEHRCVARDVAASDLVAVATDEDVLVRADGGFEATGFAPATAVGFHDGRPIAAADDGRIAFREAGAWTPLGSLDGDVRAIDGDLLATDGGVSRIVGDEIADAGLDDVRDVSASGVPLAATGTGLYELGNGWVAVLDGDFRVVGRGNGVAHAASADAFYERRDGEWAAVDLPVAETVVDVAYGDCPYVVTGAGTLLTGEDDWRPHPIGVGDVAGIAVR